MTYILQSSEKEDEKKRLNDQHNLLKLCFNGNFKAPIKELLDHGINILDIGCGTGIWCLDMEKKYNKNIYWGIDINEKNINAINKINKKTNCIFKVGNIINEFPLEEKYFDFIHQRLLVCAIPKNEWINVINNIKKVIKNNGWIELVEFYYEPFNVGPKFERFMKNIIQIVETKNLDPYIAKKIKKILTIDNSFKNIKEECISIPLNWNGDIGIKHAYDLKIVFRNIFLNSEGKKTINIDSIDDYIDECFSECKKYKTYFNWYIINAQYQELLH